MVLVHLLLMLFQKCEVEVKRDGKYGSKIYERGKVITDFEVIGETKEHGTKTHI